MNKKKQLKIGKSKEVRLQEAREIALYFIKDPDTRIVDAKNNFNLNDNVIRQRCKLLFKEDKNLYNELIKAHPEFDGLFGNSVYQCVPKEIKQVTDKEEKPKDDVKHIRIKDSSGVMIIDIPKNYKPTSKRKCKSISGKKKVLGHHLFKLAVGSFSDDSISTFDIKADYPDEAIHIMKCMIDHYKLTGLSKNKIKIIESNINLKSGMKVTNKNILSSAV